MLVEGPNALAFSPRPIFDTGEQEIYGNLTISEGLTIEGQSSARAYLGSSQSVPHDAYTKINLDTESWDIQNEFDTTNHRFTVKKAGKYLIIGTIDYSSWSGTGNLMQVHIYKNGNVLTWSNYVPGNAGYVRDQVVTIAELAAGDYIELYTFQNSGASQNLFTGSDRTYLEIYKLA
jgi:hypothetical protein